MRKLIVLLFFIPFFAGAQTTHTVAPKETLYSLARKYNIHPKDLAAYNNISVETGLTIGQVIKIPAKGTKAPMPQEAPVKTEPVVKTPNAANSSGGSPIYHKVQKKETLYHISKLYNNLSIEDIKKWNNLSGDGVTEGTNLIVGYQAGKKTETAVVSKQASETAVSKKVVTEPTRENPVAADTRPVVPVKSENVKQETNKVTGKNFNGGFFKPQFNEKAAKEETGTAAVFKSTSGWEDGKYYCLHNTAAAGSIIKITSKHTQRTVYAKVLDVIPDLKQNAGILIRLSNAAADELGVGESNFEAILNY